MASELQTIQATLVKVGQRVRRDMGDLTGLAESIRNVGLLHPPVVDSNYNLIAGRRRFAALTETLGNEQVVVLVVDGLADAAMALQAERDENTCRKDMTPSELVEVGMRIEELERPKAKERSGARTDLLAEPGGQIPPGRSGKTRDLVGKALGVSGKTYERAKAVVEAAEAEPEKFADVKDEMDKTGKIAPAFEEVRRRKISTEKPDGELKIIGVGVFIANEAINCLIRIPKNDALRKRGLQLVTDWIKKNA